MKNIVLLIIVLILATSCKEFLTQDPIDQLGESGFYTTDDEIDMAMIACYNGLQPVMQNEWMLTEMRSDNSRIYSANTTSNTSKEIISMDHLNVETTHSLNQAYWESTYHNIANCNTVLSYLDVVSDPDLNAQLEGEALFIRSYHYFNLVRLYGPLFKVTERIGVDEANAMERTSIEEMYQLIIEDLTNAIGKLPMASDDNDKGRANVWVAKALLAKVHLTLGDYDAAETLLVDVEANSGYSLLSSGYSDVFNTNNEMNDEIIFAVRYLKGGYGLGSPFANYFAAPNSLSAIISYSGDGFNCPSHSLLFAYESDDQRKDVTLASSYVNEQGNVVQQAWVKKYFSDVSIQYDAENDWPVIRFADILLMLAEIKLEKEGVESALQYLNQTRTRAGLVALTSVELPNELVCQLAIEKERRLEFAMENHRYFDLIRTKRFIPIMENHFENEQIQASSGLWVPAYTDPDLRIYMPVRTIEDWQLLLPVPFSVISVATDAAQNPGY